MEKYRKGSAGAADQKMGVILSVVFGLITVAVLALQLFIPSMYRDAVKDASTAWNIVGVILTALSGVSLIVGAFWDEETKGFKWAWIILLALGFFSAAGWYDTPHSYLHF